MSDPSNDILAIQNQGAAGLGLPYLAAQAANIRIGDNPPYSLADFLNMYPQFASPATINGNTTAGEKAVTGLASTAKLYVGGPVTGDNIPFDATVESIVNYATITISAPASGTGATTLIINQTILPAAALQMYAALASTYLQQARWRDTWAMAMGLFIAHFATLYLQSMAAPGSPADAVVSAGTARGLVSSETAGPVSVSYESIATDLDGWAAWKLTAFGQQLATFAKIIGKGPMLVW